MVNIPHLAFASELDTLRWDMRSGHNGTDSKETRFRHYFGSRVPCKLSLFRDFK